MMWVNVKFKWLSNYGYHIQVVITLNQAFTEQITTEHLSFKSFLSGETLVVRSPEIL